MCKQKIAYAIALFLGLTSILGNVASPIFTSPSTVNAESVTQSTIATYHHHANSIVLFIDESVDNGTELKFDTAIADTIQANGKTYTLTEAWDGSHYPGGENCFRGGFADETEDDHIYVEFTCPDYGALQIGDIANITVKSYSGNPKSYQLIGDIHFTIPVERYEIFDGGYVKEGFRYLIDVGSDHSINFYFVPSTSGNYTFTSSNTEELGWGPSIRVIKGKKPSEDIMLDDTYMSSTNWDFISNNGALLEYNTFYLKQGETYKIYAGLSDGRYIRSRKGYVAFFAGDTVDLSVLNNGPTGTPEKNPTSRSTSSASSPTNTTSAANATSSSNRTTSPAVSSPSRSSSSSSSSRSDDDDDSSSKSFSDGGTKTGGSGSSKGDYKKAGKTGAKYTMAEISDKATTAKVPATVKIGKKTYNVTAISSDAFIGYSNLKTVTIGKNIKKIGKNAFSGCSSLKTLTVNSKKLTAKNIKGALKGSAVKTVYVPADKVQAYKKIFTKKITGSKNKITVKAIK